MRKIDHATRRESERAAVAECVRGREQELIPAIERRATVIHTSGPWKADFRSGCWRIRARGMTLAVMDSTCVNQEDNACLIAAAPELLEACKAQLALIEDMARFIGQMSSRTTYALFNEAPIKARRAIRAAEGGGLQVPKK